MLHVRLIVPAELRGTVTTRLEGDATVCHLTVLAHQARLNGSEVLSDADLFLFDVPLESANALLEDLKAAGLHERGGIVLHRIDTTLSATAEHAERIAHGSPSEAVIWDEISARVGMEATLSPSYLAFLLVATLIAAIAVLTDSPVLVIGAMVVGPEFGPLAAVMLALHRRRWADAGRASWTLLAGFLLAGLLSAAMTAALDLLDAVPAAYVAGATQFTRFISHPDLFSVLVALLAGVAGVLSLTEGKAGTLVGVLISVTTIPALANIGVAAALNHGSEAIGALVQLAVNVGCLLLVGVVTLGVQARLLRGHGRRRRRVGPAGSIPR
ncbi:MAG: DUF389 domain-containing protein [Acidimicrobiales bacterium]|nr:DUF389 domain-containing protein [Acidimicrobiales bacterium]